MTPQNVRVASLELGDHDAAHRARSVDAPASFGPAPINQLKAGAFPLLESSLLPGEIVDPFAAICQAMANESENPEALVSARFKAMDCIGRNPADATLRKPKRTRLKSEEMLAAFRLLQQPCLEETMALLSQWNPSLVVSMTKLARVMDENGLFTNRRGPASLLDPQFVERVGLDATCSMTA